MSVTTSSVTVLNNSLSTGLSSSFGSTSTLTEENNIESLFAKVSSPYSSVLAEHVNPSNTALTAPLQIGFPNNPTANNLSKIGSVNNGFIPTKTNLHGPMAILTPCSTSHQFEERRIPVTRSEEHAIKIGRAVARFQPSNNNAIFDCKVLSRNHAVLWYDDGTFFIKDTRSSNGTFVNNQRLSNSGEESSPRALHSGDILQLGVEIVDNAKNVASGCITCIIRMIKENGEESLENNTSSNLQNRIASSVFVERIPANHVLISHEKFFMMTQYMKEARFREKLLCQKLKNLESVLGTTQEAAEAGWQALINEERLLSRIEILENQLGVQSTKGSTVSSIQEVREEIRQAFEDRTKAEMAAKDSLRKAEEQIYESSMRVHDVENSLMNLEEENTYLKKRCVQYDSELERQRIEYSKLTERFNEVIREAEAASHQRQSSPSSNKLALFSVSRVESGKDPTTNGIIHENDENTELIELDNGNIDKQPERDHVYFQEAQVQTDPIDNIEVRTTEPSSQINLDRNPNPIDAEFLFFSVFPLVFLVSILFFYPFNYFMGSAGQSSNSIPKNQDDNSLSSTNDQK